MGDCPFSNRVIKDLRRLSSSKNGYGHRFYDGLLKAAGFLPREGSKHTIYVDPDDPDNFVIVPRHNDILGYVARATIAAIEQRAKRLQRDDSKEP